MAQIVGREHWGHLHQWTAIGTAASLLGVGAIKGVETLKGTAPGSHVDYGLNWHDGSAELTVLAAIFATYTFLHALTGQENKSIGRDIEEDTVTVRRKKRPNIR